MLTMKNYLLFFIIVLTKIWLIKTTVFDNVDRNISVVLQSNVVLIMTLTNDLTTTTTTDFDAKKVICDVNLNGKFQPLGNWTSSQETPILKGTRDISLIYNHRLTGSFHKKDRRITISINNATFSDSGTYRCSCEGQMSSIQLNVIGGAVLLSRKFSDKVTINENSSGKFKFDYCGNPPPIVIWSLKGQSTQIKGTPLTTSVRIPEQTVLRYGLNTHCYRYEYTTPKLQRDSCNLTSTYTVQGNEHTHAGKVSFLVRFKPEKLTGVQTIRSGDCLTTRWNGPTINALFCRLAIDYEVQIVPHSGAPIVLKSYSTTFEVCDASIDINTIATINVRYVNKYDAGDYVSTAFVDAFSLANIDTREKPKKESNDGFKNIAISTSSLLGLLLIVVIGFIIYYCIANWACKCCGSKVTKEERGVEPRITPPKVYVVPEPKTSAKVARKNRIRKENIVHKPQALSQVTAPNPLVKSKTFSGFDSLANRHTDEVTLQKGYMPLNTLQRRISESLQADIVMSKKTSMAPMFEDIFENPHVEDFEEESDSKRNSGASAQTECTSLSTLDMAGHLTLERTTSLESTVSDYDMPYHIDIERMQRKSIYDLPRSQTFHGGSRPNIIRQTDVDGMSNKAYGSEYALPNINPRLSDEIDGNNRMSMYDSPRKSSNQTTEKSNSSNQQAGEETNNHAGVATQRDDLVIYDKPRVNILSGAEILYDKPRCSNCFETPVPSQVMGVYDTPKIHRTLDNYVAGNDSYSESIDNVNENEAANENEIADGEIEQSPPSENFYDNMNLILSKYGVSPASSSAGMDFFDEIAKQDSTAC